MHFTPHELPHAINKEASLTGLVTANDFPVPISVFLCLSTKSEFLKRVHDQVEADLLAQLQHPIMPSYLLGLA